MRRGELALSTNAIVVLVVAVLVLGLTTVIIVRGFDSADSQLKAAEDLPAPRTPTAAQPLTVSVPATVKAGGTLPLKFAFRNVGDTAGAVQQAGSGTVGSTPDTMDDVILNCGNGVPAGNIQPLGIDKEVNPGQVVITTRLYDVDAGATLGRRACTLTAAIYDQVNNRKQESKASFFIDVTG